MAYVIYFSYHLYALFSLNSNKELLVGMRVFESQVPFMKTYSNEHYDIVHVREYIVRLLAEYEP